MAFYRCGEVDRSRTVVRDVFLSYDYQSGKAIGLKVETVQASKRMRGSDKVPTSVTLLDAPVYFRAGTLQVFLETRRREYEKFRGLAKNLMRSEDGKVLKGLTWMHCMRRTCYGERQEMLAMWQKRSSMRRDHLWRLWVTTCLFRRWGIWSSYVHSPTGFRRQNANRMLLISSCLYRRQRSESWRWKSVF